MKIALLTIGILLALIGLDLVGQGTGLVVLMNNSLTVNHIEWAVIGAWCAALGAALVWFAGLRLDFRHSQH